MNCAPLASDLIHSIRERLKPSAHDGLRLTPDETCQLLSNLRTVEEMAAQTEEEKTILERQVHARTRQSIPIAATGNVIRLPVHTRLVVVGGTDGGDAA